MKILVLIITLSLSSMIYASSDLLKLDLKEKIKLSYFEIRDFSEDDSYAVKANAFNDARTHGIMMSCYGNKEGFDAFRKVSVKMFANKLNKKLVVTASASGDQFQQCLSIFSLIKKSQEDNQKLELEIINGEIKSLTKSNP